MILDRIEWDEHNLDHEIVEDGVRPITGWEA